MATPRWQRDVYPAGTPGLGEGRLLDGYALGGAPPRVGLPGGRVVRGQKCVWRPAKETELAAAAEGGDR